MHTKSSTDIVAFDAQAVRASVDLVERATARDLARPTPCADWTLHGLLRHMIAQHYGFAAASAGDGDLAQWMLRPLGEDPAVAYLVDYVVHSWDVARTLGLPVNLDPSLLETALRVAQAVPGGAARLEPGAAFGPMVDWPGGPGDCGSDLDRIVALLGRSPGWRAGFVPAGTAGPS